MPEGNEPETGTTPEDNGGDSGLDVSLYPGLENVPQDARQYVDPILEEASKNANTKFEDYNNQLKTWEPYAELGIQDKVDPQTMGGLLGLYEAVTAAEEGNTEQFAEWWNNVGDEFSLWDGDEENDGDGDGENEGQPDIDKAIAEGIQKHMAPFLQAQQQAAEAAQVEEQDQVLDSEFEPIKKQLGDKFSPDLEAKILRLGLAYNENPVANGFKEFKAIAETGESNLFKAVENQPSRPEGAGIPNTGKKPITSFKDAESIAEEYLRQMDQANA